MSKNGLGCLLLILMVPVGIFLRGFVLAQVWSWFVVPLGVTAITLPWALGISITAWLLTDHSNQRQDESQEIPEIATRAMARVFLVPGFALVFGWLYHAWM